MFLYHLIMYGRYHNQIFNNRQIYMKSDEFRASFILFHLSFDIYSSYQNPNNEIYIQKRIQSKA